MALYIWICFLFKFLLLCLCWSFVNVTDFLLLLLFLSSIFFCFIFSVVVLEFCLTNLYFFCFLIKLFSSFLNFFFLQFDDWLATKKLSIYKLTQNRHMWNTSNKHLSQPATVGRPSHPHYKPTSSIPWVNPTLIVPVTCPQFPLNVEITTTDFLWYLFQQNINVLWYRIYILCGYLPKLECVSSVKLRTKYPIFKFKVDAHLQLKHLFRDIVLLTQVKFYLYLHFQEVHLVPVPRAQIHNG